MSWRVGGRKNDGMRSPNREGRRNDQEYPRNHNPEFQLFSEMRLRRVLSKKETDIRNSAEIKIENE